MVIAWGHIFAINELDLRWHRILQDQTNYLDMKELTFAENENMVKLLLTWVMIKNVDTSVTTQNFILTCSSGALYNNYGRYTISKLGLLATTSS